MLMFLTKNNFVNAKVTEIQNSKPLHKFMNLSINLYQVHTIDVSA